MGQQPSSHAPLIVAIVLLLMLLYVGSYFALVMPGGRAVPVDRDRWDFYDYRINSEWPPRIFWPLEFAHRKLHPEAWRQFRSIYDPPVHQ